MNRAYAIWRVVRCVARRYAVDRYSYSTQRASIATRPLPPWTLLRPAPSQIPQSARREDQGEAPQPAEGPECPDEEKSAGGFGDLAVMCPLMWMTGMAAANNPMSSMMTCPDRRSGSTSVPYRKTARMSSAVFELSAFDIPRTMSSVM